MKQLPYFLATLLLISCTQKQQTHESAANAVCTIADKSQAEQMGLKGRVRFVIESVDELLTPVNFFFEWPETYHYRYISEEQGFNPYLSDDDDVYEPAPAEYVVEDGEDDEYWESEPDLGLYEARSELYDNEYPLRHYWFDEKGDITETRYFGLEGGCINKTLQTYDDNHHCLIKTEYGEDGKLTDSYKAQYDSLGRLVYYENFLVFVNSGEVEKHHLAYNEQGKLLTDIATILGKEVEKREFRYDEQGNCIYRFAQGRGYHNHYETIYNEHNKPVVEYTFNPDGTVQFKDEFFYDRHGNEKEKIVLSYFSNPEGDTVIHDFSEYNHHGNCTRFTEYFEGNLEQQEETKYDAYDNVIYLHSLSYSGNERDLDFVESVSTCSYNSRGKGKLAEDTYVSNFTENVSVRHLYFYNSNDSLCEMHTYKTSLLEKNIYGEEHTPQRLVERKKITYDSHGNWIQIQYYNTLIDYNETLGEGNSDTRKNYNEVLTAQRTRMIEYYD